MSERQEQMRRRDKPLDIHKKLALVRSLDDVHLEDDNPDNPFQKSEFTKTVSNGVEVGITCADVVWCLIAMHQQEETQYSHLCCG